VIINVNVLVKKKLIRSLTVYSLLGFLKKVIPLLLLPILTRVLKPEDYGIMAMFATVQAFFGPFIGLGTVSSIERYYFDRNQIDFPVYLSQIVYFSIFTTIVFGGIFFAFSNYISSITKIPSSILWITIIVSFGTVINRLNLIIYRVQNKSLAFAGISILETVVYFCLMLILILVFKLNWIADFYSQIIVYSLLMFYGIYVLKMQKLFAFKLTFNKKYLFSALSYGLPMFVHTFGLFFVNMIDKVLLTHYIGIRATGIYSIGFKMSTIMLFFVSAFNNAYVPWLYSKLATKNRKDYNDAIYSTRLACILIILFSIFILFLLPFIYPILIGRQFSDSLIISKIIIIGEMFNSFYLLLMNYILFEKKTYYIMLITLVSSILSILINIILIPLFSIQGAAFTLLIIYFIKFVLTYYFSKKIRSDKKIVLVENN